MRTFLRGKFTLLFMMLGLLLAIPAVALADRLDADADTLATATPNANDRTANQQPGTTTTYDFSAAVVNTGADTNTANVFRSPATSFPDDKVTVTNLFSGSWVNQASSTPGTFEITAYNQNHAGKISVTVPCEATTAQTVTVNLSAVASNTTANLTGASQTVNWTITPTGSPSASCPTANAGGPYEGNEGTNIALSGSGNDPDNGPLTYAWDLDNNGSFETAGQNVNFAAPQVTQNTDFTVKLQVTDNQGLTATDTATVTVRDVVNTAPVVNVQGVANDANYEINDVPSATCQVTDAEDTNESATPVFDNSGLNSYGLGSQTVTCSYTDNGPGTPLSDSDSVTYNIVDTGDPVITHVSDSPASPNGSNQWYTSAVTTTFQAEDFNGSTPPDTGAGFAGHNNPYTFTVGSGTAEGSAVTIPSGTVTDVAGNEGTSINSGAFKIDLSDPTNVQFSGGPDADSSHYFGSVPAAPTCTAEDAVSGMPAGGGCVVTGYSTAVGNHTMTATATDNAGRTETAERSYTVLAWTTKGFHAPVDMNNTVNTVKGGSTVPLKFELFAGTNELTSTDDITSLTATKSTCAANATEDAIEVTATGGTSLRYDSTGGQFIYNWKTPTGAGCYTVTLTADDGSKITAYFKSLK
jgi:hypothetical protein